MDYCLPGAQSCIIWAFPFSWEALKAYFSKKERTGIKKEMYIAYSTGWKIAKDMAAFIEENSEYQALPLKTRGSAFFVNPSRILSMLKSYAQMQLLRRMSYKKKNMNCGLGLKRVAF